MNWPKSEEFVRVVSHRSTSKRQRLHLARRFRPAETAFNHPRKAAVAVAIIAATCLGAAGCSAASSIVNSAASAQGPDSTSGGLGVPNGATVFAAPSSPVARPNPIGPPADPFQGTPADHWADGVTGIVLPTARAIREFTKSQVEFAYQTTKKLLIAGELNKTSLLGGPPTAYAKLLTHDDATQFLSGLTKKGVDKQGYPLSTRSWIMSFPPGDAQLIGNVIKVHSGMYAKATTLDGSPVLDVYSDYIFVYPIEPPGRPADWMRIVNEVAWIVSFGNWQGSATAFEPWVSGDSAKGGVAGALCGTTDGYQHPDYPNNAASAQSSVSPTSTPIDPYQLGKTSSGKCQATTGT